MNTPESEDAYISDPTAIPPLEVASEQLEEGPEEPVPTHTEERIQQVKEAGS